MLESGLVAGIGAMGGDAYVTGVLPTPGIAHEIKRLNADAGIVVSASHNPFFDNGIKFFNKKGFKLSDDVEDDLEALILDDDIVSKSIGIQATGQVYSVTDAADQYRDFLKSSLEEVESLKGMKIVLDCSNGATFQIAPALFTSLGTHVHTVGVSPDGLNINDGCGSQHPQVLAQKVLATNSNVGLAFDGDGDRLIAVDENGHILSGDQLLAIFAKHLSNRNLLANQVVVSTVMSNLGLGQALDDLGVKHVTTKVGDRYVMEKMLACGAVLGGEDSGHLIFLNYHTTGDGILAALQLIKIMHSTSKPLSEMAKVMTVYPQILINVAVSHKPDINQIHGLPEAVAAIERQLGNTGRVLIRYSGTQSMCRIMVEAPSNNQATEYCSQLADIINNNIGK
jgi:phosphoglucosamine mutase